MTDVLLVASTLILAVTAPLALALKQRRIRRLERQIATMRGYAVSIGETSILALEPTHNCAASYAARNEWPSSVAACRSCGHDFEQHSLDACFANARVPE